MLSRSVVRAGLLLALVASLTAIGAAIMIVGPQTTEVWATVAAALAVITSVISAWSAQRVLELAEDEQQAYPYPSIDVTSRYGLMQLRVTNFGGTAAHNLRIHWSKPIRHLNGAVVRFTKDDSGVDIPVLLPKESTGVLIGGTHEMFAKNEDMTFSGELEFEDASGKRRRTRFRMSADHYRPSLTYSDEPLRTHYELQKVPKEIEMLTREVRSLRELLEEQQAGEQPPAA